MKLYITFSVWLMLVGLILFMVSTMAWNRSLEKRVNELERQQKLSVQAVDLEKQNYAVQVHDDSQLPTEIVYTLRWNIGDGKFTWTNSLGFGGCVTNAAFSITTWKTN